MDQQEPGLGISVRWIALLVVLAIPPVLTSFLFMVSANGQDQALPGFFVVLVLEVIYLAPTIVAVARNTESIATTVVINVFLGWSLFGWVFALVTALGQTKADNAKLTSLLQQAASHPPPAAPILSPDGFYYWDGSAWRPVQPPT
jgi:hypothetical protein